MHYVIAGGSGFVGGYLAKLLISQNHQVTILTHSEIAHVMDRLDRYHQLRGKIEILIYDDYHGQGDVLINFAGESLGSKQITTRRLNLLLNSRLDIINKLKANQYLPPVYIQGSAVSIYPDKTGDNLTEQSSTTGSGDIAELARKVENAAMDLINTRQESIKHYYMARFGLVLHRSGGLIKKASFIPPFTVIHGDNKLPFIELGDAARALILISNGTIESGPVNLTTPYSATLKELLHCCYRNSKLPPIPIITGFLKLGDRRMQLLQADQTVIPQVLLSHDFSFRRPHITDVE